MTQLSISTSPQMTWLWAAGQAAAGRLRAELDAAGKNWTAAQRGREPLPLVTDIGIGVDALTACEAMAAAGFAFTWHESVHPLNRDGWPSTLPGMPRTT